MEPLNGLVENDITVSKQVLVKVAEHIAVAPKGDEVKVQFIELEIVFWDEHEVLVVSR